MDKARELFEAFLWELCSKGIRQMPKNDENIHRAFIEAQKELPDCMKDYSFSLRGGKPYLPILDYFISDEYRQKEILTESDGKINICNITSIKMPEAKTKRFAGFIYDAYNKLLNKNK